MVDRDLVSNKLSRLSDLMLALRSSEDIDWERFQRDIRSRAFVERYLHLAVEEVIDIANRFVSFYGWREPAGYRDLFAVLAEYNVLPADEVELFQNMVSFRNLLVHRYDKVDDEIVFGIFRKRLGVFDRFGVLVRDWMENEHRGGSP